MTEPLNYSDFQKHFYFAKLQSEELLILMVLDDEEYFSLKEIIKGVKHFLKEIKVIDEFTITMVSRNSHRVITRLHKMGLIEKSEGRTIQVSYRISKYGAGFKKWFWDWRKHSLNKDNWDKTVKVGNITSRIDRALGVNEKSEVSN